MTTPPTSYISVAEESHHSCVELLRVWGPWRTMGGAGDPFFWATRTQVEAAPNDKKSSSSNFLPTGTGMTGLSVLSWVLFVTWKMGFFQDDPFLQDGQFSTAWSQQKTTSESLQKKTATNESGLLNVCKKYSSSMMKPARSSNIARWMMDDEDELNLSNHQVKVSPFWTRKKHIK